MHDVYRRAGLRKRSTAHAPANGCSRVLFEEMIDYQELVAEQWQQFHVLCGVLSCMPIIIQLLPAKSQSAVGFSLAA